VTRSLVIAIQVLRRSDLEIRAKPAGSQARAAIADFDAAIGSFTL
jgi:hypothetical protein